MNLPIISKPMPPVSIHYDNEATICIAKQRKDKPGKYHMRLRYKNVRSHISHGVISLDYVRSVDNILDPFTKSLASKLVLSASIGMDLKPML